MADWAKPGLIKLVVASGLLSTAFFADAWVVELFEQPIRSGQTKAALMAMRAWGEGAVLLVLALAVVSIKPQAWKSMVAVVVITVACAGAVDFIKPIARRYRPSEVADFGQRTTWLDGAGRNSSFPSGHVATAFAFGRGLSLMFPQLRPVCLFAASSTAVSRMYDRRHYLSDCVAGGLFGWYVAGILFQGWTALLAVGAKSERSEPKKLRRAA